MEKASENTYFQMPFIVIHESLSLLSLAGSRILEAADGGFQVRWLRIYSYRLSGTFREHIPGTIPDLLRTDHPESEVPPALHGYAR